MKIAITGANGYLGSVLTEYFSNNNTECLKLVRNPVDKNSRKFILGQELESDSLDGVDCLIHVAHDFSQRKWCDIKDINIDGASKLFCAAKNSNVKKIIFISTMSSYTECKSNYGKSKFQIERDLISNHGGYIIRPGLIYGDKQGGMFLALSKLAQYPVLPLVGGSTSLYMCHYLDLIDLINRIMLDDKQIEINKPIIAANNQPYTLKHILKFLGARNLIDIPWQIVWCALKLLECIGVNLKTGSDNLISLVNQDANPDFSVIEKNSISFNRQPFCS